MILLSCVDNVRHDRIQNKPELSVKEEKHKDVSHNLSSSVSSTVFHPFTLKLTFPTFFYTNHVW